MFDHLMIKMSRSMGIWVCGERFFGAKTSRDTWENHASKIERVATSLFVLDSSRPRRFGHPQEFPSVLSSVSWGDGWTLSSSAENSRRPMSEQQVGPGVIGREDQPRNP